MVGGVTDVRTVPLAGQRFAGGDVIEVRAPYDGAVIGAVPLCGADEVDRAVAAAATAHRNGPLPAWRRAEVLDAAARLLAERGDRFARPIQLAHARIAQFIINPKVARMPQPNFGKDLVRQRGLVIRIAQIAR